MPKARHTTAGFGICTLRLPAQRKNGTQFPEKLDGMAVRSRRLGRQNNLINQTPQDIGRFFPRVLRVQRTGNIRAREARSVG